MDPTFVDQGVAPMYKGGVTLLMWGRDHRVGEERFDALQEPHFAVAISAAEEILGRHEQICVLKVGVLGKDESVDKDPNGIVVDFTDVLFDPTKFERVGDHSVRSLQRSNVGVVRIVDQVSRPANFAFRTGDSPFLLIVMRDEMNNDLAVFFCHAGRPCLMPDREGTRSVVETVWEWCRENGVSTKNPDAVLGGGIGSCCYGFDDAERLRALAKARYGNDKSMEAIFRMATTAPRKGQVSVDLGVLALNEFYYVMGKSPHGLLAYSQTCTACYGKGADEDPELCVLHSSARGHGPKVRSLAVATYYPG